MRSIVCLFLLVGFTSQGQSIKQLSIKGDFTQLPNGGHLQGVQLFEASGKQYMAVSGSSAKYAYYLVGVATNDSSFQLSYIRLMDSIPFKHAGGFQVTEHFLAIGIEDDESKDSSKILVYDVSHPGISDSLPIAVHYRGGIVKESTAGAVAAMWMANQLNVAIASWDANTLDFVNFHFDKEGSRVLSQKHLLKWSMQEKKQQWPSKVWNAYQSINYFNSKGKWYLCGTGRTSAGDVADLFIIDTTGGILQMAEAGSYVLPFQEQSVRNGGGIHYDRTTNTFSVLATPAHPGKNELIIGAWGIVIP
ncbi:MAG: hypothetical protein SFW35_13155 [Chitinophagales bacterium]|nr:hypothetical protein [Chitinophagales bacterium]